MLAAQQETWDPPLDGGTIGHDDEVDLKVFLMNDQQYNIRGRPTLQTEDILEVTHPIRYLVRMYAWRFHCDHT